MPSMTYCTASAASSTPSKRDSTMFPVMPRSRTIGSARTKAPKQAAATMTTTAISKADQQQIFAGASRQQHGRRDCTRAREQRDRQWKGGNVADMLFDRLLRGFTLAAQAHAEHHFGSDREQQQATGNPECG